mgnify:CR=1 FL=1
MPPDTIRDEEVLCNFVDSLERKDGFVRRYLEEAQIGVCIGNTLFVHGGLQNNSIGFVPSLQNRNRAQAGPLGDETKETLSVQEWIDLLNTFKTNAIEEWKGHMRWNGDRSWRGGEALMGNHTVLLYNGVTLTCTTIHSISLHGSHAWSNGDCFVLL